MSKVTFSLQTKHILLFKNLENILSIIRKNSNPISLKNINLDRIPYNCT